jgi:fructose-1,6-bisphosphatase I
MQAISMACKFISSKVRRAGMTNLFGTHGNVNATGDEQKKLDVLSNEVFINALKASNMVFKN